MTPAVTAGTGKRPGYGQLLRTPGAWTFLLPGFAARQPFAMLGISIVLLVEHTTGSYGSAGAVSATAGVAMALFAPQGGKLADRFGQRAVLIPGVLAHSLAVGLLTTLALLHAPLWALLLAAVPAGGLVPQAGPMVRARWAAVLTRAHPAESPNNAGGAPASSRGAVGQAETPVPLLDTAAAFESVTDEFTFVIGPVLATALCTSLHPAAGLVAEASLILVGGLLFAAQRRTQPAAHREPPVSAGRRMSALSVPGVRVLAVLFFGVGTVFGGMQVSLTAFTEDIGRPGINGLLYGVFAAGNMVAGAVCGAVRWRRGPRRRLLIGYPLLVLATAPLWALHVTPLLATAGLVVGLFVAPALITGYTLVDTLVPVTARTEAFTWLTGSVAFGQALAASAAGQLADGVGPSAGFTVPLAGTGLALLLLLAARDWLTPPAGGRLTGRTERGVDHASPVSVD